VRSVYPHSDQLQELFSAADEAYALVKADLVSPKWARAKHGAVERHVCKRGRELMRTLFQAHVTLRARQEPVAVVVDRDGGRHTHVRRHQSRLLETTFGTVCVERTCYSGRGLGSLFPADADLNLPSHRYSHELERVAVLAAVGQSYDRASGLLADTLGAEIAKRPIESIAARAAMDFDAFYRQRHWKPASQEDTGPLLILSFDQKGIVMRADALRPETRRIAAALPRRFRAIHNRDGKKHWCGRKRMAAVATVYTSDRDLRTADAIVAGLRRLQNVNRPSRAVRPQLKRVWASLEQAPETVVAEAFAEAEKRDPMHTKTWVVLIDGDPKLRRWVKRAAQQLGVRVTIGLDLIHVLQYLWAAGEELCGKALQDVEEWVLPRLRNILLGKAMDVVAGMRRSATRRKLAREHRSAIDRCARYIRGRKSMMRYHELLAWGAPIATGVIEGSCKHLINDRMDLCGARWSESGAEAMLRLRAIHLSGDFDAYWEFHEHRELDRNHRAQYAGRMPAPLTPLGLTGS